MARLVCSASGCSTCSPRCFSFRSISYGRCCRHRIPITGEPAHARSEPVRRARGLKAHIVKQVVGGANRNPGDPVTFTLSIRNIGTATASGVIVTDTLSGCGLVSGGPWSWNATWQNSSQPTFVPAEVVGPEAVEPVVTTERAYTVTLIK